MPCSAFYEWRTVPGGAKEPFAIARQDGEPLALAGLWESLRTPEGEVIRTFAILTTAANTVMAPLHERMPVILEQGDWATWLGEDGGDAPELMRPAPDQVLRLWPVATAVNAVRNNGPHLLAAVAGEAAGQGGPNPA